MELKGKKVNTAEVEVTTVDIKVQQILNDLHNGLTWFNKDDLGYGSIQQKYNATTEQIALIRKHPQLKDKKTKVTVFNIISGEEEEAVKDSSPTLSAYTEDIVVQENKTDVEEINNDDLSAFINL